jgi:ATP-dependent DNA helicase RecG
MTIEELSILSESEDKIEFKAATKNYTFDGGSHSAQADRRKCFLGYVVALANEGGGKLVLGMEDQRPHNVCGSDFAVNNVGNLENEVFNRLQIRIHCTELFDARGKRVLVTAIPSRPMGRLLKYEGVPLMRTGESLRNMTDEEMYSILSEQEPDFSAKICDWLTLADLDQAAIDKMKEKYAAKQRNVAFKSNSDDQVLIDLDLMMNGKLTYAALILLAKEQSIRKFLPQAQITWEYRANESQIHYDSRENICLPLFLGIDQLWKLIQSKNNLMPVRSEAYINEVPAFNEDVVREAILNAVAHRDYTITSEVVIKQYPKKMLINNPGGFPKGVNLENILTVNSTPRSRLMTEVLQKTGLVERSGQGVDKIFTITLSEGKPEPTYQDSNLFQVSLALSGELQDKAFHFFIQEIQSGRGENNLLGAEQIIALWKVCAGQFGQVKGHLLASLQKESLISKLTGNTNRYTLNDRYYTLASKEQRIGKRYIVTEVEQFLFALQGQSLKIGELETKLSPSISRNQIKYLISKLFEDKVIQFTGTGRGTRYKMAKAYDTFKGESLAQIVFQTLREKVDKN